MDDDAIYFRKQMAENGYEYTPKEAKASLGMLRKVQKHVRKYPELAEELSSLSTEERLILRRQVAESGCEVSPDELDSIIELICKIDEGENERF